MPVRPLNGVCLFSVKDLNFTTPVLGTTIPTWTGGPELLLKNPRRRTTGCRRRRRRCSVRRLLDPGDVFGDRQLRRDHADVRMFDEPDVPIGAGNELIVVAGTSPLGIGTTENVVRSGDSTPMKAQLLGKQPPTYIVPSAPNANCPG